MKCHYEELNVPQDASESDIKTSYRKLALRWHPDKNPDCSEEAKEKFQLIQQAYEVLSDPHERAWYDKHRDQILRGKNSDYEENCLDLFQYFTVSCFKGYGDDPNGFYGVYGEVFEKIAAEDVEFMDDEEDIANIPKFGDSQSNYEEVVAPFYAYWQAYCTKKNYAWLCKYDIQEIKERRILREIEKEMKKIVQKAKKERNEEVRNLVAFVRKRDKRVLAYKTELEERAALNRQKQEQIRLEQIRKRRQELEESQKKSRTDNFQQEYEEQLKQLEQQYNDATDDDDDDTIDDDGSEDDEDENETNNLDDAEKADFGDFIDDLYCVACNKSFKNDNAFANHETSKKHKENLELLRQQMHQEEDAYKKVDDNESIKSEDLLQEFEEKVKLDSDTEVPADGDSADVPDTSKSNKKSKKSKKSNKPNLPLESEMSDHEVDAQDFLSQVQSDDDDWSKSNKKATKKNKSKKQAQISTQTKPSPPPASQTERQPIKETSTQKPPVQPQATPAFETTLENEKLTPTTHTCVTCNAVFNSKNKLFAHLKLMNHGVYIQKPKQAATALGVKKTKGKRK